MLLDITSILVYLKDLKSKLVEKRSEFVNPVPELLHLLCGR